MAKDPAFLFYSKDFYEGTRMMLPEEKACYIDLLIYQHQNGPIPNEPRRLTMYCCGIAEATLIATLEAKFELTENGWVNKRLEKEINEREKYKKTQSESGRIGQLMKKAKQILSAKDFKRILKLNDNKEVIIEFLNNNEVNEATLQGLLKQRLNNNAIEDEVGNEDIIILSEEGVTGGETETAEPVAKMTDVAQPSRTRTATGLHQRMVDVWSQWYQENRGIAPKFSAVDGAKIKSIKTYLEKISPHSGEDEIISAWSGILDAVPQHAWVSANLSLAIIDSKLNEIISLAMGKGDMKASKERLTAIENEQIKNNIKQTYAAQLAQ